MMGTPQAACAGALFPKVLVTVEPLKPYMEELLKGVGARVQLLTRPNQDPHLMALSPSQARALDTAEIIITPGDAMNAVIQRQLAEKAKHGALVIVLTELEGADALPFNELNPWIDEDAHENHIHADEDLGEGEEAIDPHMWMDPLRMAAIARPLAEAIATKAPSLRGQLLNNADQLAKHLRRELHPQLSALLAAAKPLPRYNNKPYIPFVTYHDAFQYFLERYDLPSRGVLLKRPEDYLGAGTTKDMISVAERTSIGCIITESKGSLVTKISMLSGAQVVSLNPEHAYAQQETPALNWLKNDYDRLLYRTAAAFAECLGK